MSHECSWMFMTGSCHSYFTSGKVLHTRSSNLKCHVTFSDLTCHVSVLAPFCATCLLCLPSICCEWLVSLFCVTDLSVTSCSWLSWGVSPVACMTDLCVRCPSPQRRWPPHPPPRPLLPSSHLSPSVTCTNLVSVCLVSLSIANHMLLLINQPIEILDWATQCSQNLQYFKLCYCTSLSLLCLSHRLACKIYNCYVPV